MASASNARLLIVDDDAELGNALSNELAHAGYRCDLVLSGPAALDEIEKLPFDAVISDLLMEGMNGLELLETLTRDKPQVPVIVMTGMAGVSARDAMARGAFHYFTKPLDVERLQAVIERALGERELAGAPMPLHHPLARGRATPGPHDALNDVLLPTGPAARALLARIGRLAAAHTPVLILGESGTGKELVARALHARGPRMGGPFVTINAAAIPEHLLESELFGHVRGAFSGATQARRGLLLEANHGTVLLDEIGDMPLGLQAKLLRAVQFGEVRAVGSDRPQYVDVRFLAATHRNLRALAEEGKFRSDLYYRLSVLELRVPPLRERREEIPALIEHFVAQARKRNPDSPVRDLAPAAVHALASARWVGNIRELASTIERLIVLGQNPTATLADLEASGAELTGETPCNSIEQAQRDVWTLDQLTQHYVDWTLTRVAGDKAEAARILGINISTLYRWIRRRSDESAS